MIWFAVQLGHGDVLKLDNAGRQKSTNLMPCYCTYMEWAKKVKTFFFFCLQICQILTDFQKKIIAEKVKKQESYRPNTSCHTLNMLLHYLVKIL